MGSRYTLIKELENDPKFYGLLQKGMVALTVLDRKCYYERYLLELKTHKKAQAITNAAEEYKTSEMTIRRAIKFMEE